MKRHLWLLSAFLILSPANTPAYTEVSGDLAGTTNWIASGSPYVLLDSVRLMVRDTLNIEAGVVIKGATSSSGLIVYGVLSLQGTEEDPVIFTSYKDDEYGEDTNGDGYATLPSPGDWARLWIRNTWQEINIANVVFRYGGEPYDYPGDRIDYTGVLSLNGSLTTVENCTFEHNRGGVFISDCSPQVKSCAFQDCSDYALHVNSSVSDQDYASRPVVSDNTFSDVEWPFYQFGNSFPVYSGNTLESTVQYKAVLVSGQITADSPGMVTLPKFQGAADVPYVMDNLIITINVTFIIESGVVIKVKNDHALNVQGTLDLPESGEQPVVFTSFNDDSYGGDTNGDGFETTPAAGDYLTGLRIQSERENTIQNALFRYGGAETDNDSTFGALQADSCSPTIQDCRFENNEVGVSLNESSSTVKDNSFENNSGYGVNIDSESEITSRPAIANNTFAEDEWPVNQKNNSFPVYSGNVIEPSVKHRGILLSGNVKSDTAKTETLEKFQGTADVPYVIKEPYQISINVTLVIKAGAVIKLLEENGSMDVDGILKVDGIEGKPVVFTSIYDDSYGGDTNGDGSETEPLEGDWARVALNNDEDTSKISNALFRYGGGYFNASPGVIQISAGSPEIENSVFGNNLVGVTNTGDGVPVVNNCDFVDNPVGVDNLNGNTSLDCKNNYWGDSGGPSADSNPGGAGASVTGNVDYSNFSLAIINPLGRGDLNQDGSVDVSDLVRTINIILGKAPVPTVDELAAADVNGDGLVNIADLVGMVDIILGKSGGLMLASGGRDALSPALQGNAAGTDGSSIYFSELINLEEQEQIVAALIEVSADSRNGELSIFSDDPAVLTAGNKVAVDPQDDNRVIYRFVLFSTTNQTLVNVFDKAGLSYSSGADISLESAFPAMPVHLEIVDKNRAWKDLTDEYLNGLAEGPEESQSGLPEAFILGQNHPNPFNPSTTISYTVPENQQGMHVRLSIYNTRGALVASLVDMAGTPGAYSAHWDGTDSEGRAVSSGVYFYRLQTGAVAVTRKMVLIR
jgi:parallel beta-helix repeat protein